MSLELCESNTHAMETTLSSSRNLETMLSSSRNLRPYSLNLGDKTREKSLAAPTVLAEHVSGHWGSSVFALEALYC